MNFDQAFDRLLGHEGAYSWHPEDPGGETMWGVTARVARASGYTGDMKALPQSFARHIYKTQYWDTVKADQLPGSVRFDVFDAAVNSGVKQASKWLQYAVNAKPDGSIGPATIEATYSAGPQAAARFNGWRLSDMTDMGGWPTFNKGWARRIASNLKAL